MNNALSRRKFLGTAAPRPSSWARPRCFAEVCTTRRHLPMARPILPRRSIRIVDMRVHFALPTWFLWSP